MGASIPIARDSRMHLVDNHHHHVTPAPTPAPASAMTHPRYQERLAVMEGDIQNNALTGFGTREHEHRATDCMFAAKEICCHPSLYLKHHGAGTLPIRPPHHPTHLATIPSRHPTGSPPYQPSPSPRSSSYLVPHLSRQQRRQAPLSALVGIVRLHGPGTVRYRR